MKENWHETDSITIVARIQRPPPGKKLRCRHPRKDKKSRSGRVICSASCVTSKEKRTEIEAGMLLRSSVVGNLSEQGRKCLFCVTRSRGGADKGLDITGWRTGGLKV